MDDPRSVRRRQARRPALMRRRRPLDFGSLGLAAACPERSPAQAGRSRRARGVRRGGHGRREGGLGQLHDGGKCGGRRLGALGGQHPHQHRVAARRHLVAAGAVEGHDDAPHRAALVLVLGRGDAQHAALADLERGADPRDVGAGQVHHQPRRVLELEDRVGGRPGAADGELHDAVLLRHVDGLDGVGFGGVRRRAGRERAGERQSCKALEVVGHGYSSRLSGSRLGRERTVWVRSRVPSARMAHSATMISPVRTAATVPPFLPIQAPRRTA